MSKKIKASTPYTHVDIDDHEVKAGGTFFEVSLDSFPVNLKICLSIHKNCRDKPLLSEILKRSFKVTSVNLSDPDKPEIVFEEVGPLPDLRSRLPS